MTMPTETWVKVCGLTRPEDVSVAVEAGADAIGCIIVPSSPRAVTIDAARRLGEDVPVRRVLVSADLTPEEVLRTAEAVGFDGVQPHGRHSLEAATAAVAAGLFVLQPVAVRAPFVMPQIADGAIPIFDTATTDRHGGTGRAFEWDLIADYPEPFVLAGGLGPDNVAAAVEAVQPFGVDAASRLEAAAGIKDHSKVTAFVREAKRR